MKPLNILCQERYNFIANPEQYLKDYFTKEKAALSKKLIYFFRKKKIQQDYEKKIKSIKSSIKEYVKPTYVYYKGNKIAVPNDFYIDYKTPDIEAFIKYLEEDDRKKNIITDEDREKARLLNCNLDYNYLQTLMNKVAGNPDLVVTIQTKDAAVITLRTNKKLEPDVLENEVFVKPTLVR